MPVVVRPLLRARDLSARVADVATKPSNVRSTRGDAFLKWAPSWGFLRGVDAACVVLYLFGDV